MLEYFLSTLLFTSTPLHVRGKYSNVLLLNYIYLADLVTLQIKTFKHKTYEEKVSQYFQMNGENNPPINP